MQIYFVFLLALLGSFVRNVLTHKDNSFVLFYRYLSSNAITFLRDGVFGKLKELRGL